MSALLMADAPPAVLTFEQAWTEWSEPKWQENDGAANARSREIDRLLFDAIAGTPSDVAFKLRAAMWTNAGEPWVMALALGGMVPGLPEKLEMADATTQALWSSIVSLEAVEARS